MVVVIDAACARGGMSALKLFEKRHGSTRSPFTRAAAAAKVEIAVMPACGASVDTSPVP